MNDVQTAVPETNGAAPRPVDAVVIESLRTAIAERNARRAELQAEIDDLTPELKRYEKALALLLDQVPSSPLLGRPRGTGEKVRPKPSKISPEKLGRIEAAARAYAEDHDEFRQVDVRATMSGPDAHSAAFALAFEVLRQRNVLRIARVQGNSKFYRLTRDAMRAEV